jgi:nicotinate phosphoribosyltransferase
VVFPREPLLRLEGPLGIVQLLETTLLNLVNFPSLVATNAARMRLAVGPGKALLEFGLRRAQGPDGAISASKYSYLGGFDATSNVLAGKLFDIGVKGTHAHSFVMSFTSLNDLFTTKIFSEKEQQDVEFVEKVLKYREALGYTDTNEGELAAFISYAVSFPTGVLCLIDTYETLASGAKNFICVGLALHEVGYNPIGIRLDSGDLAYWSKTIRHLFQQIDAKFDFPNKSSNAFQFSKCSIVASNDINEDILLSLNREGHEIDVFGIGTHLVTCQRQPALGCVYKLVEINNRPRIKLSQEIEKMVIPGKKLVYRLYGNDNIPLVDLMQTSDEEKPEVGKKIMVRHPFAENKRAYVTPSRVEELMSLVFDGQDKTNKGIISSGNVLKTLAEKRNFCIQQLAQLRHDHIRPLNPTPYKISVSQNLYDFIHDLWMRELPITELA